MTTYKALICDYYSENIFVEISRSAQINGQQNRETVTMCSSWTEMVIPDMDLDSEYRYCAT